LLVKNRDIAVVGLVMEQKRWPLVLLMKMYLSDKIFDMQRVDNNIYKYKNTSTDRNSKAIFQHKRTDVYLAARTIPMKR